MSLIQVSVVVPAYNQKERLALVLEGLRRQTFPEDRFEVLVVDDGSTDGTGEMLRGVEWRSLRILEQSPNQGRNRARNLGISRAKGELVVFLDGDALPAPDLVERYWEAHQYCGGWSVLCGFQRCLPDLEYFQDPRTGSLIDRPVPSVLKDYLDVHRAEMVLTEEMVRGDFGSIAERSCEGGYPFPELKERQDQVRELLRREPTARVRWLGFIPHNGAVARKLLEREKGFDEEISFSEGWELAYRLQNFQEAGIHPVEAETYHLYHYHEFEEAGLQETGRRYRAIEWMARKLGDPRVRLLYFWYASLWPDPFIPEEAVVEDLIEFDRRYRTLSDEEWKEYQNILDRHPIIPYHIEVDHEKCT